MKSGIRRASPPDMENTHIHCDACGSIQPMVIEPPEGEDVSGRYTGASDILCGRCGLVITTTYRPKADTQAREALGKAMPR